MSFHFGEYATDKALFYQQLNSNLQALLEGENKITTALANASALLFDALGDINWAGFYMESDGMLVLGPFNGKPACTRIAFGKGVCGTAAKTGQVQLVEDVHLFPGHIACDSASNSEVVVPMIINEKVIGVLDIDSPLKNRFCTQDAQGLQQFCDILLKQLDFSQYRVL